MKRRPIVLVLALCLALVGCAAPAAPTAQPTAAATAAPSATATLPPAESASPSNGQLPTVAAETQENDMQNGSVRRGNVFLDSVELVPAGEGRLPSLLLKGSLPTPCHRLEIDVAEPDAENRVDVQVYSIVEGSRMCAQVIVPFEQEIPLEGLRSGGYTVWVNGRRVGEIENP